MTSDSRVSYMIDSMLLSQLFSGTVKKQQQQRKSQVLLVSAVKDN